MISKLSRQEKLIFAAVFLALLTHFVSTLRQTYVEPLAARKVEDSAVAPMPQRNVNDEQASSEAFSSLFGVKPQTTAQQTEQPKAPDTLIDMQPKLLAIDEVSGKLTARLWLNNLTGKKLLSVSVGDEHFGYKLSNLTPSSAEFTSISPTDEQQPAAIRLQLFKAGSE